MKFSRSGIVAIIVVVGVAGCALTIGGDHATLPVSAGTGPTPVLPPEVHALIPTAKVATVVGWKIGATPIAAAGLREHAGRGQAGSDRRREPDEGDEHRRSHCFDDARARARPRASGIRKTRAWL